MSSPVQSCRMSIPLSSFSGCLLYGSTGCPLSTVQCPTVQFHRASTVHFHWVSIVHFHRVSTVQSRRVSSPLSHKVLRIYLPLQCLLETGSVWHATYLLLLGILWVHSGRFKCWFLVFGLHCTLSVCLLRLDVHLGLE